MESHYLENAMWRELKWKTLLCSETIFLAWPILRSSSLPLNAAGSVHTHFPMAIQVPEVTNMAPFSLGYTASVSSSIPHVTSNFSLSWSPLCTSQLFSVEFISKHHFTIIWPLPDKKLTLLFSGLCTILSMPPKITLVFPATMSCFEFIFHLDLLGIEA